DNDLPKPCRRIRRQRKPVTSQPPAQSLFSVLVCQHVAVQRLKRHLISVEETVHHKPQGIDIHIVAALPVSKTHLWSHVHLCSLLRKSTLGLFQLPGDAE